MKKLCLLAICCLFLLTGCGEKKEQEESKVPAEPSVDTRLEISKEVVSQLNQLLENSNLDQQFEYIDSKTDDDNYVTYTYQTQDKVKLDILINAKGKVSRLTSSPAFEDPDTPIINETYQKTRTMILKLDYLHINSTQYEELEKCALHMDNEIKRCEIDNFEAQAIDNYYYALMIF